MKRTVRLFTAVALAGLLVAPAVLVADLNDGSLGGSGHADDPVGVDRPSTMPDGMDRDDGLLDDRGDAAGDAPLDDDLDDDLEDDLDRHDQGLEDPLDEPANIPAPGM